MSGNRAEGLARGLKGGRLYGLAVAAGYVLCCVVVGLAIGMGMWMAADRMFPPDIARLAAPSTTVTDSADRPLSVFLAGDDSWRLPATVADVSPMFIDMLLAYEDRRYHLHPGVDPLAMARAMGQNLAAGRVVSGASTITMQVARLLEPRPRGWSAKFLQVFRALQLEWRYDKTDILNMYLTLAPYGGNVEGIRAAAWAWFGKSAAALTPAEMAVLVALPRSPSTLRPDRCDPATLIAARDGVVERALDAGVLDAVGAADARAEPPPRERHAFPQWAFHAARGLIADPQRRRGELVVATTLDGDLQRAVEGTVREALAEQDSHAGIAALVVENATRAVRAHVGAPEPMDATRRGAIDMTRAVRSPGSTLKPFAYGMGFELGVIHPLSLVSDVSTRFGGYTPRNFDGGFHGDLTIAEALRHSLNVPAVTVLRKVGPRRFVDRLAEAGADLVLPRGDPVPGLPVVLGGVGIDLWDLTSLYVAMAREGVAGPLLLRRDDASPDAGGDPPRLMSAEAARATLRILEGTPPPEGRVSQVARRDASVIALKTGTSFGFRDAWAVGVSSTHTIAVWVGRPDGTPLPGRYGLAAAAPIVYRLFDLLPPAPGRPSGIGALANLDAEPPVMLRRVATGAPTALKRNDDPPRLVFPPPGAVVERGEAGASIRLEAKGGRRPLTWLVDGRPLDSQPLARDAVWRPASNGFARITVIDARGANASAAVEVR